MNENSEKDGFWLKESLGGSMGAHLLVMRGDQYVAHLYEDGQSSQDWNDLLALIEGREPEPCRPTTVQITLRRPQLGMPIDFVAIQNDGTTAPFSFLYKHEEQCPVCGDHHEPDAVPFGCETGDGV